MSNIRIAAVQMRAKVGAVASNPPAHTRSHVRSFRLGPCHGEDSAFDNRSADRSRRAESGSGSRSSAAYRRIGFDRNSDQANA